VVMLSCPMYVDQIEYITKEFRIDRVFYISGNEKAVATWRDAFCEDGIQLPRMFNEIIERLEPIVTHFSRLGKLEQFDVIDTPKPQMLKHMIEQATMPQFAIINGLSAKTTSTQADMLAASYGVGPALTTSFIEKWAKEKLKRTLDVTNHAQMFSALQQYGDSTGYPLLVLNRYPNNDKDAAAFLKYFGEPKVAAFFNADDPEAHMEQFKEENPEDETDAEELATKLEGERKQHDKNLEEFKAKCPSSLLSISMAEASAATAAALHLQIRKQLLPKVYVLVAPSGKADFSRLVANTICTSRREGKRPTKFTIIDSDSLFRPGGHSAEIEDKLTKAAFMADAPDTVPAPLWKELFAEALQASANPMGSFLVTNFPTPCCLTSTPTIRDQFSMLESISTFMGIVHVTLTESAYNRCVAGKAGETFDFGAYSNFESQVKNATLVQFGADKIKDCVIDQAKSAEDAARAVAADFLSFQERVPQQQARK